MNKKDKIFVVVRYVPEEKIWSRVSKPLTYLRAISTMRRKNSEGGKHAVIKI